MRFPYGEWRVCYSVYSGGKNELPNGSGSSRRGVIIMTFPFPAWESPIL